MTYFRTPTLAHTCCHRCSGTIPKGEPMAFQKGEWNWVYGEWRRDHILCEDCAAELGIKAVDSQRMLAARQLQLST